MQLFLFACVLVARASDSEFDGGRNSVNSDLIDPHSIHEQSDEIPDDIPRSSSKSDLGVLSSNHDTESLPTAPSNSPYPPAKFPNPFPVDYVRFGNVDTRSSVWVSDAAQVKGLRFARIMLFDETESCVDDFVGFDPAKFVKGKATEIFKKLNYKPCGFSPAVTPDDNYEIESSVNCDQWAWLRLDCQITPKSGASSLRHPIQLSRMTPKLAGDAVMLRGFRNVLGMSAHQHRFNNRIRCSYQDIDSQVRECAQLLHVYLQLADEMQEFTAPAADEEHGLHRRKTKVEAAQMVKTDTTKKDAAEKKGDELDTTTILLIVGGALLLLGALIAVFKMMASNKPNRGRRSDSGMRRGKSSSSKNPKHSEDEAESAEHSDDDDAAKEARRPAERRALKHGRKIQK